jgi:DnaJ-class molecular chaperone
VDPRRRQLTLNLAAEFLQRHEARGCEFEPVGVAQGWSPKSFTQSIPEGTQSGKQFRLKAKGMPVLRSSQFGDMYIQANVETPVNLTRRQRGLLRECENASRDNSPHSEGLFAKAKGFWEGFGC